MIGDKPRRFFAAAAVAADDAGFGITLDGKRLRSPAGGAFRLPSRALAATIADEWNAQGERIEPATMPLMQLAATALDRMPREREKTVAELLAYGETDLLCYRAVEPPQLVERQAKAWDPILDWARRRYDIALAVTGGIAAIGQNPATLATLRRAVAGNGDFRLTALSSLVRSTGSLLLALAIAEGVSDAESGAQAAQLDELFQAERWGGDAVAEACRAAIRADIAAARRFLDLLE